MDQDFRARLNRGCVKRFSLTWFGAKISKNKIHISYLENIDFMSKLLGVVYSFHTK